VRFDHPAPQIVLQDYIHALADAQVRVERLIRQIEEPIRSGRWRLCDRVLQTMRGVGLIVDRYWP